MTEVGCAGEKDCITFILKNTTNLHIMKSAETCDSYNTWVSYGTLRLGNIFV